MHDFGARQGWVPVVSSDVKMRRKPARSSPSQNPDPAAQQPIDEAHAARERRTVFLGGALLAGAALGTAAGTVIAGPLGVLLGGAIGIVVGGLGGMAAGVVIEP